MCDYKRTTNQCTLDLLTYIAREGASCGTWVDDAKELGHKLTHIGLVFMHLCVWISVVPNLNPPSHSVQ